MSGKRNRYHERNARKAEQIQKVAKNNNLPNGVSKEITIEQALSILFRSRQLKREGSYHSHLIDEKEKLYQIEECYKQRYENING